MILPHYLNFLRNLLQMYSARKALLRHVLRHVPEEGRVSRGGRSVRTEATDRDWTWIMGLSPPKAESESGL